MHNQIITQNNKKVIRRWNNWRCQNSIWVRKSQGYYEPVEFEWGFYRNFSTCELNVDRDKTLLRNEYLKIIKPYLKML